MQLVCVGYGNAQANISGIVNQYSPVIFISQPMCEPCDTACIHEITVSNGSLFQPGDKALIIQMKGAVIDASNTIGSGNVTEINNAGNYEFFTIESISGNIIIPTYPLVRNYTVSGQVQLVSIPQYIDVNISGPLLALDWDDLTGTGGVVAIEANKVTFNADINVLGQGFQGIQMPLNGLPDGCSLSPTSLLNVPSNVISTYTKGAGIVIDDSLTNRGRAPRANGGGAGMSGDSGGGGGSNFGTGGEGGKRWCDYILNSGGLGGFSLMQYYSQNKVFLGGAGGPGWVSTNNPSTAADGGGIVIIFSDTIIGNGYNINARGTSPVPVNPIGQPDGGGGGGGGGSVVLKTEVFIGNLNVDISGGDGQDINTTISHGPGGGGGVLLYSLPTLPSGLNLINFGGIGGEHLPGAGSVRNGSQDDAVGGAIPFFVEPQNFAYELNNFYDQTVCEGSYVTVEGFGVLTFVWDNNVINGVPFIPDSTSIYTVSQIATNGCVFNDQVTVTVHPLPIVMAGVDQTVCEGQSILLSASGASTYVWSGGITQGVSFIPTVGTTTYNVTGTDVNGCVNTDEVTVTVHPLPIITAGVDQTVCEGQSILLAASGASTYAWSGGITQGVSFIPTVGTTTYSVTGTDVNGCVNTDEVFVLVYENPIISFYPDSVMGCVPITIDFFNTTENTDNCIWTISDGSIIQGCDSVSYTFTTQGCYDITLSAISNLGCSSSLTYSNLICVEDNPIASFTNPSSIMTEIDPIMNFINTSSGAISYLWDFGDNVNSNLEDPTHLYTTNGIDNYLITLIAYSLLGCTDTVYSLIEVQEELLLYVPNTFTPNHSNFNELFLPVFKSGFIPSDYTLYIFNRWGDIIFESHDPNIGWNGSYGRNGEIEMVQDGTYTWKIVYKIKTNLEEKYIVGHLNVLR